MKSKSYLMNHVLVMSAVISATTSLAYAGAYAPTTTIGAETGMNTSQSTFFTDVYYDYITKATGATNQDTPNQHISKLPISSLLSGNAANAKIYVETQSWFCHDTSNESSGKLIDNAVCGGHKDVGQNSGDLATVTAQYNDMVSRGISGVAVDWDGEPSSSTVNTQNNNAINNFQTLAEASGGKFTFSVSEDEGLSECLKYGEGCVAIPAAISAGATGETATLKAVQAQAEAQIISNINYIVKTWSKSPAYMKDSSGRPIVYTFGLDGYVDSHCETVSGKSYCASLNWTTIKDNLEGDPVLIFENSPSHAEAGGAYSWENPTPWSSYSLSSDNAFSQSYLTSVYSTLNAASTALQVTGSVFKGFDDAIVNGWGAGPRYVDQQCGQTWLNSFAIANKAFTSRPPDAVWLVTWDDYEEGTEMETGIKNCLEGLSPAISGGTLSWSPSFGKSFDGVSGSESTVDDYEIFVSTNGQTPSSTTALMKVGQVAAPTHSFDLASADLPSGTYQVFIEAVGKPMLSNYFTPTGVSYVVKGATSGTITGKVTDAPSGAAISGATVTTSAGKATTSSTGAYTITGVAAGTYSVAVSASGYITHTVSTTVAGGATDTLNVQVAAGGIIAGVVKVKSSGDDLSGATVTISGGDVQTSMSMTSSSAGSYNTSWIPIGTYTVTCSKSGYTTVTTTGQVVKAGDTLTVDCSLP